MGLKKNLERPWILDIFKLELMDKTDKRTLGKYGRWIINYKVAIVKETYKYIYSAIYKSSIIDNRLNLSKDPHHSYKHIEVKKKEIPVKKNINLT